MSRRRAVLSMLGVLALVVGVAIGPGLPVTSGHTAQAAETASSSGDGTTASGPTTLFSEDFESLPMGTTSQSLKDYRSAGGRDYSHGVDGQWLDTARCNGVVMRADATADEELVPSECDPAKWMTPYSAAIGMLNGASADNDNTALIDGTLGGTSTTAGGVIFDSGTIILAAPGKRFLWVAADVATTGSATSGSCSLASNPPRYTFLLGGTPLDAASLTACDAANHKSFDLQSQARVAGTLAPTGGSALLWGGGDFSLQIKNDPDSDSGSGDDGAIDNIRVEDVTPTVSLGADVAPVKAGETAQLAVTVANTPDSRGRLDGKAGWGFTLNLPEGVELAADPQPESPVAYAASAAAGEETTATECPAAIRRDDGAGNSVRVSDGELAPGQSSCTVTIPVRQTAGYDPGRTVRPTLTSDSLTGLDGIDRAASGRTEQVLTFTDAVAPTVPALQPSAGAAVSGVAEAGATVTVASSAATCAGEGGAADETATATAGTDGAFTVRLPKRQPDGSSLFVSVADAAGNRSACTQLMVLADPPPAPDVSGVVDGVATGTALPGTTVVVTDASGSTLVQAPVDENGRFRLRVAAPVGSEVALFSQDAAGNRSEPVTVRVAPAAAPASNRPVVAHPLARDASPAPTPARTLPRTGLADTGWPAAAALLLLTGAGLAVLARAGRRRPLPGAAPDEGARR